MMTLREVADRIGLPIGEVRQLAARGELPAPVIAGRHPRWAVEDVIAFTHPNPSRANYPEQPR